MFRLHEKNTSGTSGIPQTSTKPVLQQPTSEPSSLDEVKVRAQPKQQQQGVLLKQKPQEQASHQSPSAGKKLFQDFFRDCSRPIHRYPVLEHPPCG